MTETAAAPAPSPQPALVARMIHVAAIQPSSTPMQAHRRARFNKDAIKELADNVAQMGVLQPILVRPVTPRKGISFEIVAGERRWLAAKGANLDTLPAVVRELTELQVIEMQVIENLQRVDLHELEEAEGYEQLMKSHAYTAEQIAARVGKSKAYVYGRLKLCALCPEARKAFYDGALNASTALLLARIPVEDLQRQALKDITNDQWHDAPMSYREAAAHMQHTYMLRLDQAGFKTSDPDLLPAAGACGPCPKRTGNQPELFGDVKSKDVCTDPKCFAAKKAAHMERLRQEAEARGQEVIAGAAAKKIRPNNYGDLQGGFVDLDKDQWIGGRLQSPRKLLGKDMPETKLLQDPHNEGEMIEIASEAEVAKKLKAKGIKLVGMPASSGNAAAAMRRHERQAKMETQVRRAIFDAIHQQPVTIDHDVLAQLAVHVYRTSTSYDSQKIIDPLHGLDKSSGDALVLIAGFDDSQLARLLIDCMLVGEIRCTSYEVARNKKPESALLTLLANKAGVDIPAIREPLQDSFDAKEEQRATREKKAKAGKKQLEKKTDAPAEADADA